MYRNHSIGVVVPSYNEEGFVGDVIDTLPDYVDRIYAVDDCSNDGTWEEIQHHAENINDRVTLANGDSQGTAAHTAMDPIIDRRVVPIRHEENRGAGGAIKTGYQHALEDEIDITAVIAGDGQMDPDILPQFLDPIIDYDVDYVKGNRLASEEYRSDMPLFRLFGNAILTFLTRVASGYWEMTDPQNGYTAISLQALEAIDLDTMYEYYGYCNDLLVKLNAAGMDIADVAMPAKYGDEESHIEYPTYIAKVSTMLFRNFVWRFRIHYVRPTFHPVALFYAIGAFASLLGTIGAAITLTSSNHLGRSSAGRGLVSGLLLATGGVFALLGMTFDKRVNEDREVQIDE